jgi:hypothetical protein
VFTWCETFTLFQRILLLLHCSCLLKLDWTLGARKRCSVCIVWACTQMIFNDSLVERVSCGLWRALNLLLQYIFLGSHWRWHQDWGLRSRIMHNDTRVDVGARYDIGLRVLADLRVGTRFRVLVHLFVVLQELTIGQCSHRWISLLALVVILIESLQQ